MVDFRVGIRGARRDVAAADFHGRSVVHRHGHACAWLCVRWSAMMAKPLLEIEHLSIRFGEQGEKLVVDDLCLSVAAGERVALVGESGSGKSVTALSVLRLVEHAKTSGS